MNGVVFLVQKEHWYQYLRISAGGAHGQCKRLPLSPFPPRAQDKYCRSTEKRESSRPSALNGCVRVFINDILGPQGGPHCRHQNGKGLLTQPQQGIEHRSSIFRSRTFATAPIASGALVRHVLGNTARSTIMKPTRATSTNNMWKRGGAPAK